MSDVLLDDGTVAVVRPLGPDDREALTQLHDGVSDGSFRFRFFALGRRLGREYVAHLFSDTPAAIALVALVRGRVVALATAERVDPATAEVAFLVADDERGHGLGALLLEHLAAAGRDLGVRRFTADVLAENGAMTQVFRAAGFTVDRVTSQGVVEVRMSTTASASAVAAADRREIASEARSLAALSAPAGVAVVGARRDGAGIGAAVLGSVVRGGFAGSLVAVHPTATQVAGVPAFPRVVDAPGPVDLVVVAVPAPAVGAVLLDAAAAGARVVVVVSSGFAETGPAGVEQQRELVRLARAHSIRLVGPNCLGVVANDPAVRLNATFTDLVPPVGGLAVASQSGGVGVALLDVARRTGLGVRTFVSLGNKADVSGNDLLCAWMDDPEVTAAALYLESFGNAPKLARLARRFSETKPLLLVAGGRSAGGRRAGASHTAATATSSTAVDALAGHAGVVVCRSVEEVAATALVLTEQPHPAGPRVAVVTNAGGAGVLAADAADGAGLVVTPFTDDLRARLDTVAPGLAGASNPVDLGAGADPGVLTAVVEEVLASDEVDALLVVLVATLVADPGPLAAALAQARSTRPGVPVLLVTIGTGGDVPRVPGVTSLPGVPEAVDALARASRYAAWLAVPRTDPAPLDDARATVARSLTGHETGWLDLETTRRLLAPYDLDPEGTPARGPVGAVAAAVLAGFPVALKVGDPRVVHKSDRGLVRTGLTSEVEVADAVTAFGLELGLGAEAVDVVVQPMARGVEMALGLVRDPTFGPLVMVAAGGTTTDLLDDRVFLLPPLDPGTVARAVRSLRAWPLLDGYRGAPRADVAALERAVTALGALASEVPEVAELDLNPVLVDVDGLHLVDVKVRLDQGAELDRGVPRSLRGTR
ncbi:bifunctional acetate--CoA ligase family protein/GNAT family N-acetyltransferase [Nocardioides sp. AX2bis]|uniref:bifunctional acetate--CoA ligase family protein/GNAT family N-acetyltransferase n=1 Tax=Nocardioides sp. AX2bis TaxID=2653157 RepID=UPI0012EEE76D|nr:acetate--CoA ligase [Nocardioides sp. AX2bis]VXC54220.1 Acyl-CoA synthetase (NDP forming) [Nocardioides sp. AX2bis]